MTWKGAAGVEEGRGCLRRLGTVTLGATAS